MTQKKYPKDCISLNPDRLSIKMNDTVRRNLINLIKKIENMYQETGLMIDILTLGNIVFSPSKQDFYLFDADPLICDVKKEELYKDNFYTGGKIENKNFTTDLNTKTTDPLKSNKEHLQFLKELTKEPKQLGLHHIFTPQKRTA